MNKDWLTTPAGQLQLLLGTLAAATVFAMIMGTVTPWFQGFVRQKFTAPVMEVDDLLGRERPLTDAERAAGYALWIDDVAEPPPPLAAKLDEDRSWLLEQLKVTVFAGSQPQRLRACTLLFALDAREPSSAARELADRAAAAAAQIGFDRAAQRCGTP